MTDDDNEETWIPLFAVTRNAVAFLTRSKELPAALTGEGAGVAAGLAPESEDAKTNDRDGEGLVKRA